MMPLVTPNNDSVKEYSGFRDIIAHWDMGKVRVGEYIEIPERLSRLGEKVRE